MRRTPHCASVVLPPQTSCWSEKERAQTFLLQALVIVWLQYIVGLKTHINATNLVTVLHSKILQNKAWQSKPLWKRLRTSYIILDYFHFFVIDATALYLGNSVCHNHRFKAGVVNPENPEDIDHTFGKSKLQTFAVLVLKRSHVWE